MLRTARTLLSVYYAYMVEYRAELILWVLAGSLPLILMGVWMEAAQGGQFGLSPVEFARYFLAVFLVRQFTIVWVVWDFERDVVEGKLSSRLLQPLDPGWHYFASHIGERFARVPFAFVLVGLFFWLYPQAFWLPSLGDFLLGVLATALAFVLRYVMQYTVSMLAFWIEKASAIEQIWFLIYLFFSGVVAPLEVFPPLARQIVEWTPLPYLVYFPASIFVNLPGNRLHGFLITLAWIALFFWLNRWLWRRGLRHYSGMGA
ncbi:ABC-2 family transporter protein [Thermoleptolyngbya sp. C42_A2020_037]|uniref:ABC transporter permease n=1 Tax=Thermoleptolyngbya sp. C42_A2020_037 TaxID=2747799 RepID=UPI0019EEE009|nr:ABC-2 family transporter protein [Thermoleptolyngbya sp. C42_A2020_037]MBF2083330.1 ABC-2 family transporter protein [Thermoleptolyngbya sp. C42_A2020_037]